MAISKKKFVFIFVISVFIFMFVSNAIFGTEARVFPWHEKTFLGTDSPIVWKHVGYKILYPVKVVLMAPTVLYPDFLHDDPPPPLVGIFFAIYWSILALAFYYIIDKIKR